MTPLNERVREYMEANGFEETDANGYWMHTKNHPEIGFISPRTAQFFYIASLQAQKDELHSFIAGGKTIYESSSYSIDGTALAERLAELTKLMETNQPNTTQGGDNNAKG